MNEELKKFRENNYYDIEDVAEKMIQLSNLKPSAELKNELENALYHLKATAQNEYNSDYFRVFYNVLLVITGNECF